jgi:hypothetical protein
MFILNFLKETTYIVRANVLAWTSNGQNTNLQMPFNTSVESGKIPIDDINDRFAREAHHCSMETFHKFMGNVDINKDNVVTVMKLCHIHNCSQKFVEFYNHMASLRNELSDIEKSNIINQLVKDKIETFGDFDSFRTAATILNNKFEPDAVEKLFMIPDSIINPHYLQRKMNYLLDHGLSINFKNIYASDLIRKQYLLHYLLANLSKPEFDINAKDRLGRTMLFKVEDYNIFNPSTDGDKVIDILLRHGAICCDNCNKTSLYDYNGHM